MANEPEMPYDVREQCLHLRCKSKRGEPLTADEAHQLQHWWKDYPRQYKEMSNEVFEATKPYGAV